MIALSGGDKLMSLSEVLTRIREYEGMKGPREVCILAMALGEGEDFIRGAIEPQRAGPLSANITDIVERRVRGRKV